MHNKYRLFRRNGGVYYWQEIATGIQGSLKTKNKKEAALLLTAKNESTRVPVINLAVGRAYLTAHDPKMATRTWSDVMEEFVSHGLSTSQIRSRRAFRSKAFDSVRDRPIVETRAEHFLAICKTNGNSVHHYLRRIHNLAINLGWLPWPVVHKAVWPKIPVSVGGSNTARNIRLLCEPCNRAKSNSI